MFYYSIFLVLFLGISSSLFCVQGAWTEDPLYEGMSSPEIRYLYVNMTPRREIFPAKNDGNGSGLVFVRVNQTSSNFSFVAVHSVSNLSLVALHMGNANSTTVSSISHLMKSPISPFRSNIELNTTLKEAQGLTNFTTSSKYYLNLRTWDHLDGAVRGQIYFNQYNLTASEFVGLLTPAKQTTSKYLKKRAARSVDVSEPPPSLPPAVALGIHFFANYSFNLIVQHNLKPSVLKEIRLESQHGSDPPVSIASFRGSQINNTRFYGNLTIELESFTNEALYNSEVYVTVIQRDGNYLRGRLLQTDWDKPKPIDLDLNDDQVLVVIIAIILVVLMMLLAFIKWLLFDKILKKRKEKKKKEIQEQKKEAAEDFYQI